MLLCVLPSTGLSLPPPRENLDFPRSWLLPVLRDHVRETRLGFFTTYFLPLATTLKSKGMGLTLVLELWLEGIRKGSLSSTPSPRTLASVPLPSRWPVSAQVPSSGGLSLPLLRDTAKHIPFRGPCPVAGK